MKKQSNKKMLSTQQLRLVRAAKDLLYRLRKLIKRFNSMAKEGLVDQQKVDSLLMLFARFLEDLREVEQEKGEPIYPQIQHLFGLTGESETLLHKARFDHFRIFCNIEFEKLVLSMNVRGQELYRNILTNHTSESHPNDCATCRLYFRGNLTGAAKKVKAESILGNVSLEIYRVEAKIAQLNGQAPQ